MMMYVGYAMIQLQLQWFVRFIHSFVAGSYPLSVTHIPCGSVRFHSSINTGIRYPPILNSSQLPIRHTRLLVDRRGRVTTSGGTIEPNSVAVLFVRVLVVIS